VKELASNMLGLKKARLCYLSKIGRRRYKISYSDIKIEILSEV
jgi:hypothetical protein